MLKLRIVTAIVLIIAVLAIIFYLPLWVFNSFVVLLTAMGAFECAAMFWPRHKTLQWLFIFALIGVAIVAILCQSAAHSSLLLSLFTPSAFPFAHVSLLSSTPWLITLILFIGLFWWLLVPVFLLRYTKKNGLWLFSSLSRSVIGFCVFVPFAVALSLVQAKFGSYYLLYVLVLVWANDTGAYFVGRSFGKIPLAPSISPNKTLEGVYGGLILGLIVAICGGFLLGVHGIRLAFWVALGMVVSLWSVLGDLFESMLKRQAGIKDSGTLLPGHGGIYDRVDSLTAALPLFALGLLLL
jgi:phosphatidate cytidylyltransferase